MLIAAILILALWEAYWTVKACWKAAKADEFGWFIFLLLFSSRRPGNLLPTFKKKDTLNILTKLPAPTCIFRP